MPLSKALRDLLVTVAVLVAGTALIAATGLDIAVEKQFFREGAGWIWRDANPWRFLYRFGVLPGYLLGVGALLLYLAGHISSAAGRFRKSALFLVLLLALGPGLLVNTVFKDHWGRPRPSHLQIFGGAERMAYHQVWERGISGEGKSFPSGHASIAFYLFAPYFVLRRRAPGKARCCLALGIGYGIFMGTARMAQGGHFPSDVLWAGGIVYLVGVVLCYLMKIDQDPLPQPGRVR